MWQSKLEDAFVSDPSFTLWEGTPVEAWWREVAMSKLSGGALHFTHEVTERRQRRRQAMVMRVGLIDDGRRPSFCLVRNISPAGVQVELFGRLARGGQVRLKVGDEDPLSGQVMWVRDQVAGIRFHSMLEPERVLRITQKLPPARKRSSPRVSASARIVLRTGGRTYFAELCDISAFGAKFEPQKR